MICILVEQGMEQRENGSVSLLVPDGGQWIYSFFVLQFSRGASHQSAGNLLCFSGIAVSAWVAYSVSLL